MYPIPARQIQGRLSHYEMRLIFSRLMSETATKTIEAMAEATGLEMEEVAKIVTNGKVEIIN